MTASGSNTKGSIFSIEKQFVRNGFYVDFTYRTSNLNTIGKEPADGITFVIQDNDLGEFSLGTSVPGKSILSKILSPIQ